MNRVVAADRSAPFIRSFRFFCFFRVILHGARLWAGAVALCFAATILAATLPTHGFAATQKATKPPLSEEATPQKIQELMTLLADPKVRDWLERESKAEAAQGKVTREFQRSRLA
jgi:hypothetical protein